jgi:hypothetical protein
MKKIFTLMAVFTLALTAMAQTASIEVVGRNTNVMAVKMTNSDQVFAMGFKFQLPEGVTVKWDEDEEMFVAGKEAARWTNATVFDVKNPSTGVYSVNIYSGKSKLNEGEICYFELEGLKDGTVRFYGINFSGQDAVSYYMNGDMNTEINFEIKGDGINSISAEQTKSGVIYNMAGQRVSKATKGIYVVDGKKVAVSK